MTLHGSEPGSVPATWGLLAKWQRDLRSCNYYLGLELDPEKGVLCARTQPVREGFTEEEPEKALAAGRAGTAHRKVWRGTEFWAAEGQESKA